VVSVHHTNANVNGAIQYHALQTGKRDLIVPTLIKGTDNLVASITVQNVGAQRTEIELTFYYENGEYSSTAGASLDPGQSVELYGQIPTGFKGSVRIHSTSADIVAAIHEAHSDGRHFGYSIP